MNNPYTAPSADLSMPSVNIGKPGNPASRLQRFCAVFIDGLIVGIGGFIFQKILYRGPTDAEVAEAVKQGKSLLEIAQMAVPSLGLLLLLAVIQMALFIGINFVFLKNGQTVGKKLLGLQVRRRESEEVLPLQENIVKRILPIYGATMVLQAIHPFLGLLMIIDSVLIFRAGRNTLHDDIAKSKVVKL